MHEKLDFYDVLGVVVPGILIVSVLALVFPEVSQAMTVAKMPEAFSVIALMALAVFAGFVMQALASLIEPALSVSWGGRISRRAVHEGLGDRYLSKADSVRISSKLASCVTENPSKDSLFHYAVQIAENCGSVRVVRFNALYAYHRSLIVLTLTALVLFILSLWGGIASQLTSLQVTAVIVGMLLFLGIFWHRAKQRGIYYVREVLLCAERQIDIQSIDRAVAKK